MNILTFSSLYPNASQPGHGLFVENRLRALLRDTPVRARVVAPVPWFPFRGKVFGRWARFAGVPSVEERHGIRIWHPKHLAVPKVGMHVAPVLMATASEGLLRRLHAEEAIDVIDAHYVYPDGVAAAAMGRKLRLPVVITARGSDINLIARHAGPRAAILRAAQSAHAVIAVSAALAQAMKDLGIDEDRIRVLRNGVDLDLFRPDAGARARLRARVGVDAPILLSVGNLLPVKGNDLTIRALADLPGVHLALIGDGPDRAALEALARRVDAADRVHFLGAWPQRDLPLAYAGADALVLASAREGMPNVVLESIACGTPVIGAPVGGIPEIVDRPEAGRVFAARESGALAAAARDLLASPPDRAATRRHAEGFSWLETSLGQARIFEDCLARRERRGETFPA